MLSPLAIHLFLRYFDSIDQLVSKRLTRVREWHEPELTSLMMDLLDEEAQQDHNMPYPHESFLEDLSASDEPLGIGVRLETHSYPASVEHYITQSDLGLILSYQDQFDRDGSFRRGWLFQAKRLYKDETGIFTARSKFGAVNHAQHERIRKLRNWAKCDFIQYLLYCPRPCNLEKGVREELSAARSRILHDNIFDYSLGLELRDDLLSQQPTTAAGIFVAPIDRLPTNLLEVHSLLFRGLSPLSWFIVSQLSETNSLMPFNRCSEDDLNNSTIEALIRGDADKVLEDDTLVDVLEDAEHMRILPAVTLTIKVVNGLDRPRNHQK